MVCLGALGASSRDVNAPMECLDTNDFVVVILEVQMIK